MSKKEKKYFIKARMLGGLGNQLFIYSYCAYLKNQINGDYGIVFDMSSYRTNHFNTIDIDKLPLASKVLFINRKEKKERWFIFTTQLFRMFDYLYRKVTKRQVDSSKLDLRKHDLYYSRIKPLELLKQPKRNVFVYGYFQNYSFLKNMHERLQSDALIEQSSLSPTAFSMFLEVSNCEYPVSISIRCLAGYSKAGFHVYSPLYYKRGIETILSKNPNAAFFVFADSIEIVERTFDKEVFSNSKFVYVIGCNPCEQLFLMSKCKSHIISNSSFSWWGAFLSDDNSNKTIVAPREWWNGIDIVDFGLYISNMILLDDIPSNNDYVSFWAYNNSVELK